MMIGFGGSCPYGIGYTITSASSSFNPNAIYSGTTWSRIKGKVIVGVDENDADFTEGKIGGNKTFNNEHAHTTGNATLTIAQIPSHSHSVSSNYADRTPWEGLMRASVKGGQLGATNDTGGGQPHNHGNTGSNQGVVSLLQPYITKYVWERTS